MAAPLSLGSRAYDLLLLDGLRPLCRWGPHGLWPLLAWVLAALGAPWVALRRADALDPILRVSARPAGLGGRLKLARAMLYRRLRRLDFYLRGGPDHCQLV